MPTMDHEIVTLGGFTVAGFSSEGLGQGIPGTWQQLAARRADWPSAAQYGVGQPTMGNLRFLAGVRLPDGAVAPDGLEVAAVPAGRYLKQPYRGDRRQMATEVTRLFSSVVPALGEQCAQPLLFFAQYTGDVSEPGQPQIDCELFVQLG